jgi:hypothetical protein
MTSDFERNVADWLNTQGYPLEMRTALAFQQHGFGVSQSTYFKDPVTGDWRESDVYAYREEFSQDIALRIGFMIECKASPAHPWVVFVGSSPMARTQGHLRFTPTNTAGRPYLMRLARRTDVQALGMFAGEATPGYGIVQALGKNDQAYTAAMSVTKAAVARCAEADQEAEVDPLVEVVFPLIVIGSPLFECRMNPDGSLELKNVSRAQLHWRNPASGRGITSIDVVTVDSLQQYARDATAAGEFLLTNSEKELALTAETLQQQALKKSME